MREVPASQAKTHLPQLLDDVERGETIVITRHGRSIARIVPEAERQKDEIDQATADLKEFGKQTGRATVADVLSLIREGRKYLERAAFYGIFPVSQSRSVACPKNAASRISRDGIC